uniref:YqaJ viral recombinase domain-containing protein n=1 Tax=Plectus sambesii TaxID=2011161 RepID=A0A914UK19_9BILA
MRFQLISTPWLLDGALLRRFSPLQERLRRSEKTNSGSSECFAKYSGVDHHKSYADWQSNNNATHYSPISPEYREALRPIDTDNIEHGVAVTSGGDQCREGRLDFANAEMPVRDRALCNFDYVTNYNPKRMPALLTEVKCTCEHTPRLMSGNRVFECEPLRYNVRVLLFDESCDRYRESIETISLACLPVVQAKARAEATFEHVQPLNAIVEQ